MNLAGLAGGGGLPPRQTAITVDATNFTGRALVQTAAVTIPVASGSLGSDDEDPKRLPETRL